MRNFLLACTLILGMAGLPEAAAAADKTYPIGDLTGLQVLAADLPDEASKAGVAKDALKALAEAELKKGGFETLDEQGPPGNGSFQISMGAVDASDGNLALAVRCECARLVYYFMKGDLEKEKPIVGKQFVVGTVWSDMFAISTSKADSKAVVENAVKQSVQKFIQDWKQDNAAIEKDAAQSVPASSN